MYRSEREGGCSYDLLHTTILGVFIFGRDFGLVLLFLGTTPRSGRKRSLGEKLLKEGMLVQDSRVYSPDSNLSGRDPFRM